MNLTLCGNIVWGLTLMNTLCPSWSKLSCVVVTVTSCLDESIDKFLKLVLKLWLFPVPNPVKKTISAVLPTPTNSPVVPRLTFWVAIPIKSFVIFATNNSWPSMKVAAIPTRDFSLYEIWSPPFAE